MATTTPRNRLHTLDTAALIAQYNAAISSHGGRHTEVGSRQQRINFIVDLLSDRADRDDAEALAWLDEQ